MTERDDDGARDVVRDETDDRAIDVSADAAREIDDGVRALRDEPVAAERLARMRAGLDARIAAAEDGGDAVAPIESHPRFGRRAFVAAAAMAAAVLVAVLLGRTEGPPSEHEPRRVAEDALPVEVERDAPGVEDATRTQIAEAPSAAPRPESIAVPSDTTAAVSTTRVADAGGDGEREAMPQGELDLDAISDEELALVIEYDQLTDYDVIAQLDLLELLDAMEADGRI